jgi:ribosomal-protein-alanine N-acetyltransferase
MAMAGIGALGWPGTVPDGLRRFDPGRDLAAVIRLLELGFSQELEPRDRRWLAELSSLSTAGPLLSFASRVVPLGGAGFTGFVWYQDSRLVGNVSLMRGAGDVWLVANVVTALEYRRRGIAGQLMAAAIDAARARGARQLQLQVRHDNRPAQALYDRLGFWRLGTATTLRLADAQAATRSMTPARGWSLVAWNRSGFARAGRVLERIGNAERGGPPDLIRSTQQRGSLLCWLDDLIQGRKSYRWAAVSGDEYRGVALVQAQSRSNPHHLALAVEPGWRGRVEATLVDVALMTLARHPPFEVEAEMDAGEVQAIAALTAAGFIPVRTLDRLALDL